MKKCFAFWRLSKFKMTRFNILSVLFGYFYAVNFDSIDWVVFTWLLVGTFFVCTACFSLNQVLEINEDSLMKRTQNRPLVQKQITLKEAWIFGIFNIILGFVVLIYGVSLTVALIALIIFVSYVFIYTPLKKVEQS